MPSAITPAKFWERVGRRGPGECWPWLGGKLPSGYGYVGSHDYAHRRAYRLSVGPIPTGYEVDHVRERGCTRNDCCNPQHLQAVPPRENKRRTRGIRRGPYDMGPTCKHGHPRTPENTRINAKGARECVSCRRVSVRQSRARKHG